MRDAHAGLARALVRTFHSQISSFSRREKVRRPARSKVSCRWRCRSMLGLLLCMSVVHGRQRSICPVQYSTVNTVLYSVLYSTVLYCSTTVLYCTVYCTVLVQYCTVLYSVLYCTVLYTVQYSTVYTVQYCTSTVLYSSILYCTVQYCTSTVLVYTVNYNIKDR